MFKHYNLLLVLLLFKYARLGFMDWCLAQQFQMVVVHILSLHLLLFRFWSVVTVFAHNQMGLTLGSLILRTD